MRLGGQECLLRPGTRTREFYGRERVLERHRHRYEFNNHYREILQSKGLMLAGTSVDGTLVEIIELMDHPWFIGVQFHPEFTSTPRDGHPLFTHYIRAARAHRVELSPKKAVVQ
jgi:CTP synthase